MDGGMDGRIDGRKEEGKDGWEAKVTSALKGKRSPINRR